MTGDDDDETEVDMPVLPGTSVTVDISPDRPSSPGEVPAAEQRLIGTWILDQFRILERLGQGGMGSVFLAEQTAMERRVAVKFLMPGGPRAHDLNARFRREARAVSRLQHPHIVTVFNFGELPDGTLFLAMEYVEGQTLRQILASGPCAIEQAIDLVSQCGSALRYAHERGVVHRDFKPENVMVGTLLGRSHAKVLDFGVAHITEEVGSTRTGAVVGTLEYMSPEQCSGREVTPLSDQYSLGLVFYELLVGRSPFQAATPVGYLHKHQNEIPARPSTLRPGGGLEPLDPIVMRMLAKQPQERFADLGELQAALDSVRRSLPPVAPTAIPPDDSRQVGRWLDSTGIGSLDTLPIVIASGPLRLDEHGGRSLSRHGVVLVDRAELAEVSVWQTHGGAWRAATEPPSGSDGSLVYVDAPFEGTTDVEAFARWNAVVMGAGPLDPLALAAAAHCARHREDVALEPLLSGATVHAIELTDYDRKRQTIEALSRILEQQGVRRAARWALEEIADELITNALVHAGLDLPVAWTRQASLLRCALGRDAVVLALRDDAGYLTHQEIIASFARRREHLDVREDRLGAGLGLRVMARAARHLIVNLSPGHLCEVLAIVDAAPTDSTSRSLSLVREPPSSERRIGDRLVMREYRHGKTVALVGEIDESCQLEAVFRRSGVTWMDLAGVSSIGSRGIQAWVLAGRERPTLARFLYVSCSPAIVRQLNLVSQMTEGATVLSIQVPYLCPSCGAESIELVKASEVKGAGAPPKWCLQCGEASALDGAPAEYFGVWLDRSR